MREDFKGYWNSLYRDIPTYVYEGLIVVLLLVVFFVCFWYGWRKGWRIICRVLTIEYVFLIYCSTVIFRSVGRHVQFDLMPLWSYGAYFRGEDPRLLPENIMNVIVFIPVGILPGLTFRNVSWLKVLGIGCGISVGIEILQLVLKRGFCELDDVMHNTLGCMIGYGVYRLIYMCVNSKTNRIYDK